ncbi:MAG TPA: hypothetical protein VGH36_05345 [Acetobacteraceae bacterium]|jgi:flagellar protein FliO/FliZ
MPIGSILLACAALAAVLALILLAGRLARAGGLAPRASGPVNRLAPLQSLPLDPRRRRHLIRCDNREILLLTGGNTDLVIGWLDTPAPAPRA